MQKLVMLRSFLSLKSRKLDCTWIAGSTFLANAIFCSKRAETVLNDKIEVEIAVTIVSQMISEANLGK